VCVCVFVCVCVNCMSYIIVYLFNNIPLFYFLYTASICYAGVNARETFY